MVVASPTGLISLDVHNGWTIIRRFGCYFGIPERLDAEQLHYRDEFRSHPAILKATTRSALIELIDERGDNPPPIKVGSYEGYDLVRAGAIVHAVPQGVEDVDLDVEEERRQAGVISGTSIEELQECLRSLGEAIPVEFAGWLPIYKLMGNCGQHPQFAHVLTPPKGYHFTRSIPPRDDAPRKGLLAWFSRIRRAIGTGATLLGHGVRRAMRIVGKMIWQPAAIFWHGPEVSLRTRLRLLGAILRLFVTLRRGGGRFFCVLRFLHTRSYHSQILVAEPRKLVFLTSAPFTFNQSPWVLEIEDPTTLFFPFIHNGQTVEVNARESPYFPIIRTLLESDQCRCILTHIRSTARLVTNLFQSDVITRKLRYLPIGVKAPLRWQQHNENHPEHVNLLYVNSWSQHPGNFQVRGGLDVLEAFSILHKRYPQLRLTMRTSMIPLDESYHRIVEAGWVRVINRFLSTEEMETLRAESHVFLIPAARVHIVSLMQAMASGLAVVASDGWGFTEYLTHERNGLVVKGRYGKTSWADEDAGMLRENYEPTFSPDPEVVQGIVDAVSRLVEDHELRRRLGRTARHDVETRYSLDNWNLGLQEVFHDALNGG